MAPHLNQKPQRVALSPPSLVRRSATLQYLKVPALPRESPDTAELMEAVQGVVEGALHAIFETGRIGSKNTPEPVRRVRGRCREESRKQHRCEPPPRHHLAPDRDDEYCT